jgi:hypothetical protein
MPSPDATVLLLKYLDARVRRDKTAPGMKGRICFGIKGERGPRWWIADFDGKATTSFSNDKPSTYTVAVGVDDNGARALLGLPVEGERLQLVAGDRAFLKRFVERYLRDVSPMKTRIGLMTSRGRK